MKLYQKIIRRQVRKYSPRIRRREYKQEKEYENKSRKVSEKGKVLCKKRKEEDKRYILYLLLENEDVRIDDVFTRKKKTEAKQMNRYACFRQQANKLIDDEEESKEIIEEVCWQQKLKILKGKYHHHQHQQQSGQDRRKVRSSSLVAEEYFKRNMLVKMFATLVLLATLATCYGLTLSDSLLASQQQKKGSSIQSAILSEFKGKF